jgi:hypothetical protein
MMANWDSVPETVRIGLNRVVSGQCAHREPNRSSGLSLITPK